MQYVRISDFKLKSTEYEEVTVLKSRKTRLCCVAEIYIEVSMLTS